MGAEQIASFLNYLAVEQEVSASTQTQALNALVFLYDAVLETPVGSIDHLKRIQRQARIPVVMTVDEVREVLSFMKGRPRLIAELLYGSGVRIFECLGLRIKDIDFASRSIAVRSGKGGKDRSTILPEILVPKMQEHLVNVIATHKDDRLKGYGYAPLPDALRRKYPSAPTSVNWQYVFPSTTIRELQDGHKGRWHASPSTIQRAFRKAAQQAQIRKHATV